ncbi:shikimate kinase [Marivirga tractuosa]|uniref:Shikimate kinase n=1 Tax=Marivirga tractuosa (strain ATCC 23168 / DSM 4126 / NBRC 15989 / NCIMB 1408 / VKM B-1430 / H-43) TaxID=643867 RepID=E4TQJ0_MARTH|nr:shikimate kinase [Marivirga tractuosa]ADR23683.1 Shikimate kinase [Marivirga tractuosa DSM 4126]BDD15636.1 shikimate kinase [Marivirga tractuosa]
MRYFLLGLPGSGKSHWGRIWSKKLKLPFFDLDEVIVENEGNSINEIFKNEGEEHFRNLETFYLQKLIANYSSLILSTGGGTPCFRDNLLLMNEKGISIFLNPPIEEIANRVWNPNEIIKRPLFSDCNSIKDVQEVLQRLNEDRIPIYQKAIVELKSYSENSIKGLHKKNAEK